MAKISLSVIQYVNQGGKGLHRETTDKLNELIGKSEVELSFSVDENRFCIDVSYDNPDSDEKILMWFNLTNDVDLKILHNYLGVVINSKEMENESS